MLKALGAVKSANPLPGSRLLQTIRVTPSTLQTAVGVEVRDMNQIRFMCTSSVEMHQRSSS